MENDLARQKITGQLKTPAGLMEALQGRFEGHQPSPWARNGTMPRWPKRQLWPARWIQKAAEVVGSRDLPSATCRATWVGAADQAMAGDEPRRDCRQMIYKMASRWAGEDPQWAGAWVQRLPEGEDRVWAAKNVAFQWSRYSAAEARASGRGKLPAAGESGGA